MIYFFTLLICFVSALIQGVVGFGFAVFSMFLLPLIMPLPQAAAVCAVQTFFMGLFVVIKLYKHIDFKTALVPTILSVITVPLGVYLLLVLNEDMLKRILGVLFILISIQMIITQNKEIKIKPSLKNGIISGTLCGVISGMFNVGGPPLVMYYIYAIPTALAYKATLEFSFVAKSLSAIVSHVSVGNFVGLAVNLSAVGVIGTIIGSMIGLKLYSKVPRTLLQKLTAIMMVIMGSVLIINF